MGERQARILICVLLSVCLALPRPVLGDGG